MGLVINKLNFSVTIKMWKILVVVGLIIALLIFSQKTESENYQNFSYYSGYGHPVYSGVTSAGSPYMGQGHNPTNTGYGTGDVPEPEYY